jgi:energy-coupling factor transporter transmembrane protein EcfT
LVLRVEVAATLMTLLVLTTPWMHLLRALRSFRVPQEIAMMLAMTHRYIFLLGETAAQMFESRQSRTVGALDHTSRRRVTSRTAGVLLSKSVELSNEVYLAMQSRGFRGDAQVLVNRELRRADYFALGGFATMAALCAWVGR